MQQIVEGRAPYLNAVDFAQQVTGVADIEAVVATTGTGELADAGNYVRVERVVRSLTSVAMRKAGHPGKGVGGCQPPDLPPRQAKKVGGAIAAESPSD